MKELTKKCIGLISKTLVELGQNKSDKDILILATTLAEDLMRDWKMMSWEDIEESFRTGIRTTDKFVLNVQTYYSWIRAQKKFQSLMRQEGLMRDRMFKLEQAFLADSRPENVKLAKELKKIYKSSVTTFMRDTARLVKKLK